MAAKAGCCKMKGLIFKHYLFRSLKEPIGIAIVTGLPTVLIIIISMAIMTQIPDDASYIRNGYNMVYSQIAIMFMVSFQFFGGNVLLDYIHPDFRGDRRWRMFSMPVRTNDYVFGTLAACFLYCVIQGGIVIGISAIFLNAYWGNPWVLIATLFACAGLAQLLYMLLFLLIPKKGTVEAVGQIIIWTMMIASGWIGTFNTEVWKGGGSAHGNFFTNYGTPISLARNAITNSGFIGNNMNNALLSLGILYAVLAILAVIVGLIGKKIGFAPAKSVVPATFTPQKERVWGKIKSAWDKIKSAWDKVESVWDKGVGIKTESKISESEPFNEADPGIKVQKDLMLTSPTGLRGGRFTIYKYALLRALRSSVSLLFNAVLPLILIFIRGLWSEEGAVGFSFIGVALMYGSFMAARGILNDKLDGTIIRIFTSPVTTLQYLSQNLMAAMTPLTVQILAVGIIGSILYHWDMGFTLSLMLIYFLFTVASVAFSFAWSCMFKDREISYAMFSVLMSIVALLGGFFIPLQVLPNALRYIGALFPAYWVSNGILALRVLDGAMDRFWISAAVIALFAVLYMVYGSKRRII
jgi:ABC-2 type transport system permease protein